ncbi:Di-copper centre-containing protein [Westerdykella ornata]|uniref:Di-copper centre-containing protein n=1 Tax=Westerdykella ornata TaxID=318751 RepID=A0A6A6JCN2_WESOR|nr:Di-copper centre-containing protein [Westerdykella ornata]KAF2274321.1 Di-copper centre-containing protein [Westerdykella ornata]
MKITSLATAALIGSTSAAPLDSRSTLQKRWLGFLETDALAAEGVFRLGLHVALNGYPNSQKCTLANVSYRREWSLLTPSERREYIAAVKCLASKPARTPAGLAAGAKNRYDDFVATHINQTMSIHGTGNFLAWHRYFTWAYEQALRNECGYKGYQPYYNWARWADDPLKSPALDGSDTSMSGDGEYVAGRNNTCIPSPDMCGVSLPPGNGGGCIKSGPFKDWKVNLGPVVLPDPPNPEPFTGLGYNPRCLKRDVSRAASQGWSKDSDVASLIKDHDNFYWFATMMQGDFMNGYLGVHTAGHYTVGGDPGGDLFASPGDPFFFLHHAMIDRVWWTWQNLDIKNRQYSVQGTITVNNQPPSRNTTLDDPIDLGFVGVPTVSIREASHTLGGPFCYIYI